MHSTTLIVSLPFSLISCSSLANCMCCLYLVRRAAMVITHSSSLFTFCCNSVNKHTSTHTHQFNVSNLLHKNDSTTITCNKYIVFVCCQHNASSCIWKTRVPQNTYPVRTECTVRGLLHVQQYKLHCICCLSHRAWQTLLSYCTP